MDIGLLVTLVGILATLVFGVWKLVKMLDWEKSSVSFELTKEWTDKTLSHREVIEKRFGTYLSKAEQADVPGGDCDGFVNATREKDLYPLKIAVISLMNYFETVAVVYLNGTADTELIDRTLKKPVLRYYHKIKKLADCIDNVAGYKSWEPVDQVIDIWNKQDKKTIKKRFRLFSFKQN
jgi:hypothetical protein